MRKHVSTRCRQGLEFLSDHCSCTSCTLGSCDVCGGGEATLTTECPGHVVGSNIGSLVSAGTVDFQHGRWMDAGLFKRPVKPQFELEYRQVLKIARKILEHSGEVELSSDQLIGLARGLLRKEDLR